MVTKRKKLIRDQEADKSAPKANAIISVSCKV